MRFRLDFGKLTLCTVVLGLSIAMTYAQGCSQATFSHAANNSSDSTQSCPLQSVSAPLKILFVVDTSGSNNSYTTTRGTTTCDPSIQTCAPPTDPSKTFRGGSIDQFFNKYKTKSNFYWGFITFSNGRSISYIGPSNAGTFASASSMASAMAQFAAGSDDGDTPFLTALNAAYNVVSADPNLHSAGQQTTQYHIIFLSDGYPTDALNADGTVSLSQLNSAIGKLTNLAPGRVVMSTVYYGTINDPTASSTLQSMATAGHGVFINVDTSTTSTINIDNLVQVPCSN